MKKTKSVKSFCNHETNLAKYTARQKSEEMVAAFEKVNDEYKKYRSAFNSLDDFTEKDIESIVGALNDYRKVAIPVFDKLSNAGQKALGYTIMEEFFYLLFQKYMAYKGICHKSLFLGKGNSYVSLSFTPKSFEDVFHSLSPYIHTKDQDFVLGVQMKIGVSSEDSISKPADTVLPIVAIECKTYLERNMLDSCANTAFRLKRAMPYCIYLVAAEYMKLEEASPELTDIDEVYILCKAKNSEREARKKAGLPLFDVDYTLIIDLLHRVEGHLNAVWWNPDDAVMCGKIIRRPDTLPMSKR